MKITFLFLFSFAVSSISSAGTYHIKITGNSFIPSSLNVNAGDRIIWKLFDGIHSTTSAQIPPGAASWDYNFSGTGDTFIYDVVVPGSYSYKCNFNPDMKASFYAAENFPLFENFNYPEGDSINLYGWNLTGTVLTNPVMVVSPGLIYPDYQLSGIGNAAALKTTGADLNKEFPAEVSSGTLYASAMVNVTAAGTGDYFLHLGISPGNTSNFPCRVFIKRIVTGNFSFGLSKSTTGSTVLPVYSDPDYSPGITYLLVLKYKFNPGVNDDTAYLFINPSLTINEPSPLLVHGTSSSNDPAVLKTINLRQGSTSTSSDLIIDGIKVGTSWADILPVELIKFELSAAGRNVNLTWKTASEINNSGFEIQRKNTSAWIPVGFVKGNGTTSGLNSYTFTDNDISPGVYNYRLRQIDNDGSYSYSKILTAKIIIPFSDELHQNYPNPFNPSTTITFSLNEPSHTVLSVFNITGEEIIKLVDEQFDAGIYNIKFSGENLAAGIYIYTLRSGNIFLKRKMVLQK